MRSGVDALTSAYSVAFEAIAREGTPHQADPQVLSIAPTINRFTSLLDGFARDFCGDPAYRAIVDAVLGNGRHDPIASGLPYFTTAYFHRTEELAAEVADAGLNVLGVAVVESPLWLINERVNAILADEHQTTTLLELLRVIEEEPSLLGASAHVLTSATA